MRNKIASTNDGTNISTNNKPEKKSVFSGNIKKRLKQSFKNIKNSYKRNKKHAFIFLSAGLVFIFCICLLSNIQVGYAVVFNNETIGFVSEKYSTQAAIDEIYADIEHFTDGNYVMEMSTEITPSVAPDMYFKTDNQIADIIKNSLDFYVDACCVKINDKFAFAIKTKEEAMSVVEAYKNASIGSDGEVLSVTFDEQIDYICQKVIYTKVTNYEDSLDILKGLISDDELYTVKNGDSLWSIGIENNIPTDYLMQLNGLDGEFIDVGQKLRITVPVPLLTVNVEKRINYIEYTPFETEYIYDSTLTKGTKKTTQKGSNGETAVTAVVTLVNLQETNRIIENTQLICEPVKEVIRIGTKPKPKNAATGRFGRPVSGGYVSSAFGNRSRGYHTGLDIALSYGAPVYASDGGTVTFSGWSGGYGYMIKINHGNGYETLYAHCSRLAVKNGAKVAKGQVIAYVGSTGNSTGPHVHFEIRKNGSYMNPSNYI